MGKLSSLPSQGLCPWSSLCLRHHRHSHSCPWHLFQMASVFLMTAWCSTIRLYTFVKIQISWDFPGDPTKEVWVRSLVRELDLRCMSQVSSLHATTKKILQASMKILSVATKTWCCQNKINSFFLKRCKYLLWPEWISPFGFCQRWLLLPIQNSDSVSPFWQALTEHIK